MKYLIIIISLLCLSTACDNVGLNHLTTVQKYYEARDAQSFIEIKKYVNDSITFVEGDYVMPYGHDDFYEVFKWDSIFQTSYKIDTLAEDEDQVYASITFESIRNEFLKNSPMTCQFAISFSSGKISQITSQDCPDVDWNLWQTERDSLVSWVQKNHPELDGFIHDMTMYGAINYLKAIELYNSK